MYQIRYTAVVDDVLRFSTDAEADAWLQEEFDGWVDGLADELREALTAYKNSGHDELNEDARNGFETGEHLLLDDAIATHTLRTPVFAYRGVIDGGEQLHSFKPGARIGDAGYWSLSLLEDVAWGFASTGSRPETRIVLRVLLDAGSRVIHTAAPDLIEEMHEYELLAPRGCTAVLVELPRLCRAEKAGGAPYYLIDVELIP